MRLLRNISKLRIYQFTVLDKCQKRLLIPQSESFLNLLNSQKRTCSFLTIRCYKDKDPAPFFFDNQIQSIMKRLTGFNLEKIFKNRYLEDPDSQSEYKFFTKEDYEEKMQESYKLAEKLLQMPPIIKEREPINEILSYDPAVQGEETAKLVVTDISYGVSDRQRIIVVREPDGTLRQANWDERDRMNQIYNPRPGRFYKIPPAFEDEYLMNVLDREEYVFILDFACAQFEPDDPLFHKANIETFEHVKKRSNYEALHSTRHYGPMCFYFAWNRKIDNLLIHYIHEEKLDDAVDLINLYYAINDRSKFEDAERAKNERINQIKDYTEKDAVLKGGLEMAIQTYQEKVRERENLAETIKGVHGLL